MTAASGTDVLRTSPVVATREGRVRGTVENGIAVFRGIPYAEPPVGALRFRPPARRRPWNGVRDATRFGAYHPQDFDPVEGAFMDATRRPPQGDDCLNLNVWTPDPGAAALPVLVWLHGGSLKFGTGADALYDGAGFAGEGVVTVTLNYRLHAAGFLHVGDRPGSGAFGLLDQIAALEWVQDNISAFGGDPGAVTLAGESAGAHSVGQLLAAPAARGLHRRAILQSGAASFHVPAEASAVIGEAVLARLGARGDDDSLAAITSADLLAASREVEPRMLELLEEQGVRPNLMSMATRITSLSTYGLDVVPRRALDAVTDGAAREVDLLVGTNVDEATLYGPQFLALAPSVAEAAFGPAAATALDEYRRGRSEQDAMTHILTDTLFRIPAIQLAQAARRHSPRTHMYLFAYGTPPAEGRLGAVHGADLPFMWNRTDETTDAIFEAAGTERSPALAAGMHGAWAAFVKTGVPGHPSLPEWPAYDLARRATMRLDGECRIVEDPMADERRLWEGVEF